MSETPTAEQQKIAAALAETTMTAFANEIGPVIQAMAHELEPVVADLRRSVRAALVLPGSAT